MDSQNPLTGPVLLGFLRAGRVVDAASSVLLLSTVLLVPAAAGPGMAAGIGLALLLGLAAKYLAWRVALDAAFFALLNAQPQQAAAFDAALATFLGRPARAGSAPLRTMESRWRGTRRLLVQQAGVLAVQAITVLVLVLIRCFA